MISTIKRKFRPLERTCLHPQWLSYRNQEFLKDWLRGVHEESVVLDIGCADRWPEKYLPSSAKYLGLDYFETATKRYDSSVDLYADASKLPLVDQSIDVVLLFDVLEHIEEGILALNEINRVLKPNGKVLVQIPFMYPIHDAPHDFRRPTVHGIRSMIENCNFELESMGERGKPVETACLLLSIASAKTALQIYKANKFAGLVSILLLGSLSVLLNCFGWIASCCFPEDDLMPFSYHFVLIKRVAKVG